ncbi:hypothetical protein SUGI_1189840 [Cryptomeria japonica]|nr:hypothetical protein SUGI_1189840 [Cryptomeria japonica]
MELSFVMPSATVAHAALTSVVGDHAIPSTELSSTTVGLQSAADARISLNLAVDYSIARVDSAARVGASVTGPAIAGFGGLYKVSKARFRQGLKRQNVDRGFIPVFNAISIQLKAETEEEIDYNVSIFSTQGVIYRIRGFWPSLP